MSGSVITGTSGRWETRSLPRSSNAVIGEFLSSSAPANFDRTGVEFRMSELLFHGNHGVIGHCSLSRDLQPTRGAAANFGALVNTDNKRRLDNPRPAVLTDSVI